MQYLLHLLQLNLNFSVAQQVVDGTLLKVYANLEEQEHNARIISTNYWLKKIFCLSF